MMRCTKLLPPATAVVAVWLLSSSCVVDTEAEVRYTWESLQQNKIVSIAASYNDVRDWKNDVYCNSGRLTDPTDIPLYDGSPDIPDSIYTCARNAVYYKGKYLPISPGKYTAVCTAEDRFGYADIVANYGIYVDGAYKYFEVAFNVREILAGENVPGWAQFVSDNPNDAPSLLKSPAAAHVKTVVKDGVTYYVVRRPKMRVSAPGVVEK
jgi:hypothetical protein